MAKIPISLALNPKATRISRRNSQSWISSKARRSQSEGCWDDLVYNFSLFAGLLRRCPFRIIRKKLRRLRGKSAEYIAEEPNLRWKMKSRQHLWDFNRTFAGRILSLISLLLISSGFLFAHDVNE